MISYDQSKKILKKAKIKIKDEKINSIKSLNRVVSSNVYSNISYPTEDNAAFDVTLTNLSTNFLSIAIKFFHLLILLA